jgi:hypothetical protein
MTVLPWVLGAVALLAVAAAPVAAALVRRRRAVAAGLDRARSLCSRLDAALDATATATAATADAAALDATADAAAADAATGAAAAAEDAAPGARRKPAASGAARREAQRCLLLAGAALAGRPGPAEVARATELARTGLAALGESG